MRVGTGYRDILKMYLPLLLSVMSQMAVSIADVFFLGRLTPPEQAAGNYGFLIFLVIMVIGLGLSNGLSVLTARSCGEGKPREASAYLWHGLVLMGVYMLLAFSFVRVGLRPLLGWALKDSGLRAEVLGYCFHRAPELWFSLPVLVLNAFYVGTARPRVVSIAAFLGAGCNIFLDYAWIFGHFGFPALRVAGAAKATVASQILVWGVMVLATLILPESRAFFKNFSFVFKWSVFQAIRRVSGPLFLQNGLSIVSWLLFFTLIERADLRLLEASSVIRAFYGLTLMPALALNATVSSMVSNFLGQGGGSHATLFMKRLAVTGMIFCAPWLAVILGPFREGLAVFTVHPEVVQLALESRWSLALAVAQMPMVFTLFASITGTGHTKATLIIESASLTVYLAYVAWVCQMPAPSIGWIWFSESVYFSLLALFSWLWHQRFWNPRNSTKFFP